MTALSASAARIALLPVFSYSGDTGFVYGAMAGLQTDSGAMLTLAGYAGTRGGQSESFGAVVPDARGAWTVALSHDQLVGREFYGWGNGGDPDSSLEYDSETDRMLAGRSLALGRLTFEIGAEVRHTSSYDIEDGDLWQTLPALTTRSTWSAGPAAGITLRGFPGSAGRITLSACHQAGGGGDYTETELETVYFAPLGASLLLGLRYCAAFHPGADETPLGFMPGLGEPELLRGYPSDRFRGAWTHVDNLELRRPLFFLPGPGNSPASVVAAVFADAGQVADEPDGTTWGGWHADAGAGLRLCLGPAVIRLDCALLGEEGMALGASLGDSF
jgi:hypothetical protein